MRRELAPELPAEVFLSILGRKRLAAPIVPREYWENAHNLTMNRREAPYFYPASKYVDLSASKKQG